MSHPFHEPRALRSGLALVCFFSFATAALAFSGAAHAEDVKTINRVTDMNKKALEAYAISDFNKARQILKQALDVCNASGLDRHAIAARTHIHMGVVMIGGLNQRDLAVKQFQRALEIQPDIQVTRNVASPDVLAAFKEASATVEAGGGGEGEGGGRSAGRSDGAGEGDETGGGEGGDEGGGGRARPEPSRRPAAASGNGIIHTPVTRAKAGQPILVTARLGSNVSSAQKVVLSWKAAGEDDFASKDMSRAGGKYAAQIPASAAKGRNVAYYIEAQDSEGTVLASAGGETKPITVALGGGKKCPEGEEDCEEGGDGGDGDDAGGPPLFFALMGGWGAGYTTGSGDRTTALKVTSGFAPASIAHIAPEVGYFLKPDMRLSLLARIQMVGGPNKLVLDGKDKPAPGLGVAVLARMAWFFGEGSFHPYASLALGGGQIRHVVLFSKAKMCGSGSTSCIDTVTAGPVFAGGGGGATYDLTTNVSLVLDLNALVGFTKFTFNLDINGGLALRI